MEDYLKEINKAIATSMDKILVKLHDPVMGQCPMCKTAAPCVPWMDAKERLKESL